MKRIYYRVGFTSALDSAEVGRAILKNIIENSDQLIWTKLSNSGLWKYRSAVNFLNDSNNNIIENQYNIDDEVYNNLIDGFDDIATDIKNILETDSQISSVEITLTDI